MSPLPPAADSMVVVEPSGRVREASVARSPMPEPVATSVRQPVAGAGSGVGVSVGSGAGVGVLVGAGLGVGVFVGCGVGVGVSVGCGSGVGVLAGCAPVDGAGVGVGAGVSVGSGAGIGVLVGAGVSVGCGSGVGVFVGAGGGGLVGIAVGGSLAQAASARTSSAAAAVRGRFHADAVRVVIAHSPHPSLSHQGGKGSDRVQSITSILRAFGRGGFTCFRVRGHP